MKIELWGWDERPHFIYDPVGQTDAHLSSKQVLLRNTGSIPVGVTRCIR